MRGEGSSSSTTPTAALPAHEIGRLFDAIRSIARSGSAVLIVTHNLDEVFDITDDVSRAARRPPRGRALHRRPR
jgi:ABC-type lipoprotein export system ATPase subunit